MFKSKALRIAAGIATAVSEDGRRKGPSGRGDHRKPRPLEAPAPAGK